MDAFQAACEKVVGLYRERKGIGTLGEKTLHAVLKYYFEPRKENHEIKIASYYADIVGENGIIEIQTGNFQSIRQKLMEFLAVTGVTLVYPIAKTTTIITVSRETGEVLRQRKSPKKGSPYLVFPELYKIKHLITKPGFCLCIVLLDLCEYRIDGETRTRRGRKKPYEKGDRVPTALQEEIYIFSPQEYEILVPPSLTDTTFTCVDFGKACGIPSKAAQCGMNVLTHLGVLEKCGTENRKTLYRRTNNKNSM